MNKKDIAKIRKEFKLDSTLLRIREIYNVYTKKETGTIVYAKSQMFDMLEAEQQELFMANFKKVLTGQLDKKLFELKFNHEVTDSTQSLLYSGLNADVDVWKENMNQYVAKFYKDFSYETDTVFTFIRAEYLKPANKKSEEYDEGADDEVFTFRFILGSVNKIMKPKKAILFDYAGKEFKSNTELDAVINLSSPLEGFMFPTFNDNQSDVNRLLYSAKYLNEHFVENVLNCKFVPPAYYDKEKFELIIQGVVGKKVDSNVIATIYEEIHKRVAENEESEPPMLDYKDIEEILEVSGVENVEGVKDAVKEVMDNEHYEFKSSSLVPEYTSKSLKISTKVANVAVSPKDLKNVHQIVNHQGKRCLLIEIDEDVQIEGFTLQTERL